MNDSMTNKKLQSVTKL